MTSSKHHLPCGVVCHKQPGSQQQEDPPPHPYQGREVEGVATSWVSTYQRISFVSYPTPQPFSRRLTGVSSSRSLPQILVDFYHCAIKGMLLGSITVCGNNFPTHHRLLTSRRGALSVVSLTSFPLGGAAGLSSPSIAGSGTVLSLRLSP